MASIQPRPNGTFQLVDHKNKVYKTLKGMTETQAENYLKVYEAKLLMGEAGFADNTKKYDEFRQEILDHYKKKNPKGEDGSTYQKYLYAFRSLEAFSKPLLLSQIKVKTVEDWQVHARVEQKLADTTIFMHYRHLKAAWNKGIKRRYIIENPFTGADKPTVEKKLRRFLSDVEVDRLLVTARASEVVDGELIAALFLGCGLRRQELTHLRWQDVNLDKGELYVKGWDNWTLKTHEERPVPIPAELLPALKVQRAVSRSPLVFPSPKTGGVRDEHAIDRMFNRFYENAEITDAKGVHILRHTFGFRKAPHTDAETLRQLLGHKDIKTTQIYMHTDAARKRAAIDSGPRLNIGGEKKEVGGLTVV